MNSAEIADILRRDQQTTHYFRGVFASDELPKRQLPRPSALVVNTDPSTEPGQHWVGIFITKDGEGEYFDSYGQPPFLKSFETFFRNHSDGTRFNRQRLQGPFSTVFGQYTLFYLLHRCRGMSMNAITRHFSTDLNYNDVVVNDFIRRNFPRIRKEVYDGSFLTLQLSKALCQSSS